VNLQAQIDRPASRHPAARSGCQLALPSSINQATASALLRRVPPCD
jgi:hypothetical protein